MTEASNKEINESIKELEKLVLAMESRLKSAIVGDSPEQKLNVLVQRLKALQAAGETILKHPLCDEDELA